MGSGPSEAFASSRDQTRLPVAASMQDRRPAAPSAYSRPSLKVGVARGPTPAMPSVKRPGSKLAQSSLPVSAE